MFWELLAQATENGGNGDSKGGGNPLLTFGPLILILVVMYFLFMRPQQKQRKQHQAMVQSLHRGDEVVTIGGIHGRVEAVKDTTVVLKVAENVKFELNKASIAQVTKRKEEEGSSLQDAK
jgi:preprotein translocase subunit YajC